MPRMMPCMSMHGIHAQVYTHCLGLITPPAHTSTQPTPGRSPSRCGPRPAIMHFTPRPQSPVQSQQRPPQTAGEFGGLEQQVQTRTSCLRKGCQQNPVRREQAVTAMQCKSAFARMHVRARAHTRTYTCLYTQQIYGKFDIYLGSYTYTQQCVHHQQEHLLILILAVVASSIIRPLHVR